MTEEPVLATITLFDFADPSAASSWGPINDVVMGGISSSRLEPTAEGTAVFTGDVSLANGGGFASVRASTGTLNLTRFAGLALRVLGDGRRYKLNLKNDDRFDGVLHRVAFDTQAGQWLTVAARFQEFVPTFRGRPVRGAALLDPGCICSIGLMISDKQAGPFRLELARIEAFGSEAHDGEPVWSP